MNGALGKTLKKLIKARHQAAMDRSRGNALNHHCLVKGCSTIDTFKEIMDHVEEAWQGKR